MVVFVTFLTLAHFRLYKLKSLRVWGFRDFTEYAQVDCCHQGCSVPTRSLPLNEPCLELTKKVVSPGNTLLSSPFSLQSPSSALMSQAPTLYAGKAEVQRAPSAGFFSNNFSTRKRRKNKVPLAPSQSVNLILSFAHPSEGWINCCILQYYQLEQLMKRLSLCRFRKTHTLTSYFDSANEKDSLSFP